ncbi:MAG: histidine ammonia-lyase [bacterium]
MKKVLIDGESLTLEDVRLVAREKAPVEIRPDAYKKIRASRDLVEEALRDEKPVYGITTGFGNFKNVSIPAGDVETLQRNLLLSHAVGVGEEFPEDVVRAMLLLRLNALAKGFSGVRPEIPDYFAALLNRGITPVVYSQGSVGASGDLAPLAHLSLVLIGLGEARVGESRMPGLKALEKAQLPPLVLKAKEGLALINGTQAMTAVGCLAASDAVEAAKAADITAAMSLEALLGTAVSMAPAIQRVRAHPGQAATAGNIRRLTSRSRIMSSHRSCPRVQDAYSLRCIPQVHGSAKDALRHILGVLHIEMNSATDNPLVFPRQRRGRILSGGNFHGAPIALAMDLLGISQATLANIAERRIDRLLNPCLSDLPPFLTRHGGLNSGMMILQYTAASLVSESKILAHPASVDSIPTSGGQEDFANMGTIAARKAARIVLHTQEVLAIELLCAAQALDFRKPLTAGKGSSAAAAFLRAVVPTLEEDRFIRDDLMAALQLITSGRLRQKVESEVGELKLGFQYR